MCIRGRRSSHEEKHSSSTEKRAGMEKRGSIEIHPAAMRRQSDDSFAKYTYQDLMAAASSAGELTRGFVQHQDSLAHFEYEFSDDDDDASSCDSSISDDDDAYESTSDSESVSSFDMEEIEDLEDDYNNNNNDDDDDDICCTAGAFIEEATASLSDDSTTNDSAPNTTSGVRFAPYAQVREYSVTMQATADNACFITLDWDYTVVPRVAIRETASKPIKRLTLHQREKRVAQVTGLSLDEIYEREEDSLLQQIEEAMARSGRMATSFGKAVAA